MNKKARLIAFYLPQYHPIRENDKWWGKGFTEWTNVTKAKPLFRGHIQPKLPTDLGFYDLRVAEVRELQAQMAKEAGIEGFAYWHYWFGNGKQLLEYPFNEVLKSGKPNYPFCLAWANQTWTGIWHGSSNKTLIEQTYSGKEDYKNHFYHLLEAFRDSRYLKIGNKPIFLIYNPHSLPSFNEFKDCWNYLADKEGVGEFFFIGICSSNDDNDFNGFVQHAPILQKQIKESVTKKLIKKVKQKILKHPNIYNFQDYVDIAIKQEIKNDEFPLVLPNWDNTPRSKERGLVLKDSTPKRFEYYLNEMISKIEDRPFDKRLIFIKSWNEWAEGNYLEPDIRFGGKYLEAIKETVLYHEK